MGLEPLHLTITAEAGKAAWRIGENTSTVISRKLKTTIVIGKRPIMKMVRAKKSMWHLFEKRAGVYGKNSDTSLMVPLGSHSTVLQTEIVAILQYACKAQNYGRCRNIRIYSDNRAAITKLDESVTTSTLVWECYESLNNLAGDNQVTVLWTPGHRGIKGNETADRLTKLATKQIPTGLEPIIVISNRSVTEDINKWLAEEHQKEWYKATVCR